MVWCLQYSVLLCQEFCYRGLSVLLQAAKSCMAMSNTCKIQSKWLLLQRRAADKMLAKSSCMKFEEVSVCYGNYSATNTAILLEIDLCVCCNPEIVLKKTCETAA
jgi:hypothetical protein